MLKVVLMLEHLRDLQFAGEVPISEAGLGNGSQRMDAILCENRVLRFCGIVRGLRLPLNEISVKPREVFGGAVWMRSK